MKATKYKVGSIWPTSYGDLEIVEYVCKNEVLVRFLKTGFTKKTQTTNIRRGNVKDPYYPNVVGKGCVGETTTSVNGKVKKSYHTWRAMIRRCYSEDRDLSYNDVSVCEDWLCFANFEKWYNRNYITGYELDKDLTKKGNKVYCPSFCTFVPNHINCIIGKKDLKDKDLPTGVSYHTRDKIYNAKCWVNGKLQHLGDFDSPESAHNAYVSFKTKQTKLAANISFYKGEISVEVRNTLLSWDFSK